MSYDRGVASATGAFVMWGLLPIYWKMLDTVPAYEILCHRMAWSLILTFALLVVTAKLDDFFQLFKMRRQFLYFLLTAVILSINWLIYIWAVNSGFIIEASLGYFINPLVSVCFGVLILKEKIRPVQWLSIAIAALGVAYLTWLYGNIPWIALSLAATFACYGLLRKITTVPALEGLCLETAILFVPAVAVLLYFEFNGTAALFHGGTMQSVLLAGTGLATTVPLYLFCYAAQLIPLYLIGLLQYLAPTINLFVGIFIYHEAFPMERMIGFAIIWVALAVFIWEGLVRQFRAHRTKVILRRAENKSGEV